MGGECREGSRSAGELGRGALAEGWEGRGGVCSWLFGGLRPVQAGQVVHCGCVGSVGVLGNVQGKLHGMIAGWVHHRSSKVAVLQMVGRACLGCATGTAESRDSMQGLRQGGHVTAKAVKTTVR